MPLYVLDTDHITHLRNGHPAVAARAALVSPGDLAASVISVEEQLDGWYKLLRQKLSKPRLADTYERLAGTVKFYAGVALLPFGVSAMDEFDRLLKMKLNVRRNDLRIAAIAKLAKATVVTANVRDFARVPGLGVEDWTQPATGG